MGQNSQKIVVLYGTKYGSTKRYAEWLAETTRAEIFELSRFNPSLLDEYGVVLFGSPVYWRRIKHRSFIKRNWRTLSTKQVVIFGVAGVSPNDPRQEKVFKASFPIEIQKKVMYYPLRGAFNYSQLSIVDKLLMSGPKIRLQIECRIKKNNHSKELLARFYSPQDWTSKAAIEPIVALVKHQ